MASAMHHFKKFSFKYVFVVASFLLLAGVAVWAGTGNNVSGWAWSSNTGWLKMNNCENPSDPSTCTGTDYGVTIDINAPGYAQGYAWSANIGWISFNEEAVSDTSGGCPEKFNGACRAHVDWKNKSADGSVNMQGWARACSVFEAGCSGRLKQDEILGGWDGYIALGDTKPGDGNDYGVKIKSDGSFTGFAWGSEVLGWIKMDTSKPVTINLGQPTAKLVADPDVVAAGETSLLKVTATNILDANSCTGNFGTIVMKNTGGVNWEGMRSINVNATTVYTVSCKGKSGTATAETTVTVMKITSFDSRSCVPKNDRPQLTWDVTGAVACTLERSGSNDEAVDGSSQATPGSKLESDGKYYYTVKSKMTSSAAAYNLVCFSKGSGGSMIEKSITVNRCNTDADKDPDFSLLVTPPSAQLIDGVGADKGKKVATFTVLVNPVGGFGTNGETINLSRTLSSNMPKTSQATFSRDSLSLVGGVFQTATFKVLIDPADVKTSSVWPITITGTYGSITKSQSVQIIVVAKKKPIYTEF